MSCSRLSGLRIADLAIERVKVLVDKAGVARMLHPLRRFGRVHVAVGAARSGRPGGGGMAGTVDAGRPLASGDGQAEQAHAYLGLQATWQARQRA